MRVKQTMRHTIITLAAGAAALAALATTASAAPGGGEVGKGSDPRVTTIAAEAAPEGIEEYWTDAKMAQTQGDEIDEESKKTPSAYGPIKTSGGDRLGYGRPSQPYSANRFTRPVGKLAFLFDGEETNCSATAIGKNLILTAAHCVMDSDDSSKVSEKLAFIPNYHGGGFVDVG